MGYGGPPRLAEWLLRRLIQASPAADAILGDLAEEHHAERRARGRLGAAAWYWRQAAGVASRRLVAQHRARRPAPSPFPIPGDSFMSGLWRDFRLAVRLLAHQRAFAVVVVLTLAVGLAANATVLALVDGLVLRPFPLRDIDRLVQVFGVAPEAGPSSPTGARCRRPTSSTSSATCAPPIWWPSTGGTRRSPARPSRSGCRASR